MQVTVELRGGLLNNADLGLPASSMQRAAAEGVLHMYFDEEDIATEEIHGIYIIPPTDGSDA